MKVLAIINLCAQEMDDQAFDRIARDSLTASNPNQPNWLDWLNDAIRTIVLVRPDGGSLTQSVLLAAGTKQALPASAISILGVTRNMGANGATPGKTIRMVDMAAKSDTNRDWHTAADAGVVREVIYDQEQDPLIFYVSPPAAGKYIEMSLCLAPTALLPATVANDNFPLADLYAGPAQAWMLFRACSLQSEGKANIQLAGRYFQSFFQQLGVKLRAQLFSEAIAQGARNEAVTPASP